MRLTINLEDENYSVAKSMANEADCSISQAVNQLIRKALEPQPFKKAPGKKPKKDDLPVVQGKKTFTSDDVYRIEKDRA